MSRSDQQLPPHSLESERMLLGAMLFDPASIDDVLSIVRPEDFFRTSHAEVCRVIYALRDEGLPVSTISVGERLWKAGEKDRDYYHGLICDAAAAVPHALDAIYNANVIAGHSICRKMLELSLSIQADVYRRDGSEAIADRALEGLFAIVEARSGETLQYHREVMDRVLESILRRQAGECTGIDSGLVDLDLVTGGFRPGHMIVIGARPSMGKTALAVKIIDHVLTAGNKPVLLFSLEMGADQIVERLAIGTARDPGDPTYRVDGDRVMRGDLSDRDIWLLGLARERFARDASFVIEDRPTLDLGVMTATARRIKSRLGLGAIVVDYAQLIDFPDSRSNRQEQMAKVSRRMKLLAREADCPVILLSQLNRLVEQREDRRPRMSDLKESGAFEQDADLVLLLHRPEYYDPNESPGQAEVIIAKNRHGRTGSVNLTFLKRQAWFESIAIPYVGHADF
jgi:replicative DNA helicase